MRSIRIMLLVLLIGNLGLIPLFATTTSGGTLRNINVTDGIVTLGASPGTNGQDWETDEVFQGFSGAVDWHLTWDDNNLYLGRIGGNNAEGSVIYIRADYPGASFDNRAFVDYDQLSPDVTAMGGINFAAYIKELPYHEFRTYNAGWSGPTSTLAPAFSTQANGANMEVAIPWSAITGGNGKPSNIRLLMYQVVPPGLACPDEFVYGESPWGTGNVGDGPSVGVNDGVPTSARQPGGCNVGDLAATRWWGCYPVIGGVGSNGWMALAPNAGPDDTICETATSYFLNGNNPPGNAIGTWTLTAQPPGSPPVTIASPNSATTLVQNMSSLGTYTFVWDINYGGCPSLPDEIHITRIVQAPAAVAMPDTVMGCLADTLTLHGNATGNGQGFWSLVSGAGTIVSPIGTSTVVYGLANGQNLFQYEISNGVCLSTTDLVQVFQPVPITADAGPDIVLCLGSLTTMAANDPAAIQGSAIGVWTQLSGPSNAVFTNPVLNTTNVAALQTGSYAFLWTVSNYNCPVQNDTVLITNYINPTADAGADQTICFGDSAYLQGNDVSALGSTGSGLWSQLAGPTPATVLDATLFNTLVRDLQPGNYLFSWRVENGSCPADSDNARVIVTALQDNGINTIALPDSGLSNGTIQLNPPSNGNAPYLYSIDGLNFGSDPAFSGLASGPYVFVLVDVNGCIDSLDYLLGYIPPADTVADRDTIRLLTGFSPNGDGNNDFWEIPGIAQFPQAEIQIFNIWGNEVFKSVGNYSPWNGQRNGQDLPSANYYFVIDLKTAGYPIYKGSLTILR